MPRRDDWLDDNEYPDERDVDDLGDDSPGDDDPLTIGRIPSNRSPFWTRARIFIVLILILLALGFVLARILPYINR